MSDNLTVVAFLRDRREKLLADLASIQEKYGNEIKEINAALVTLTGKTIPEIEKEYLFDDEHPDYIKASLEEM
jgi:hypothetical protein